jgi:hypothetical protein
MLYMIDTIDVEPSGADAYISLVETELRPIMEEAGAVLEYCRRSDDGIGEPVSVQTSWLLSDLSNWNVVRKNLVLDPRWYACAERLRTIRMAGTRRFYQDTLPAAV